MARDHWATEEHIRSTGLPFTFLRDNLYADFLPRMLGADGVLRGPAADGRVSVVAQVDVAAAAVAVLRSPPTSVLMVSGAEAPNRLDAHRAFVDAAAAAGISHLVYTSFLAAAPRATLHVGP